MSIQDPIKGLSKSLIAATRSIMEKSHTVPKTEKEKKLAAMAEPKDKITHADVLKGRGVMKEDEQIDELSTDTMRKYREKAREDAFDADAVDDERRLRKRSFGHNQAGKKIIKRGDTLRAEEVQLTPEEIAMIEAKMAGVADGAMEGEKHMCATKVFHKEWAEGTPIKTMHADPDENGLIEWYDVMFEHGIERVMTEDMDILQQESHMHSKRKMTKEEAIAEISAEMKGRYKKAAQRSLDSAQDFKSELEREGEPKDSRVSKDVNRIIKNRKMGMKRANEEVQIDEAMSAADRYKHHHEHAKALLKSIGEHLKTEHETAHKFKDYRGNKGPTWGHVGSMEHVANQLSNLHDMVARKGEYAESVEVEGETLDEARGRPKLPRDAKGNIIRGGAKQSVAKAADEEPAALGYQLRKAASINKPVHFMNGEKKEVTSAHVNAFNDHMAARKTSQEKHAFQKQAHKSHADFVKAVSSPVPKAAKDTGEIVKYRH